VTHETDSGGRGSTAGNCAALPKEILVPATVYTYVVGKRYPMPGIAGGRPGSPNRRRRAGRRSEVFEVGERAEYVPARGRRALRVPLRRRRRMGDPWTGPGRVLDDVLDEYVSVGAARRGLRCRADRLRSTT